VRGPCVQVHMADARHGGVLDLLRITIADYI
jgi:hypothetical protein